MKSVIKIYTDSLMIEYIEVLEKYDVNWRTRKRSTQDLLKKMFAKAFPGYDYDPHYMKYNFNFSTSPSVEEFQHFVEMYITIDMFNSLKYLKNTLNQK